MARFIASMRGSRGEASRLGTPQSGISSHTRGWNLGGSVEMHARGEYDTASLLLTGGSNGARNLGVEIVAFEEPTRPSDPDYGPRTRFIVRLPGNVEIHGYVGDKELRAYDRSGSYDPSEPEGRLVYTFNKGAGK